MNRHTLCIKNVHWLADTRVRCCTAEERGVWIEVLMHMNQAERRGILEWKLDRIASLVGARIEVLRSLVAHDVLRGQDMKGEQILTGAKVRLPFIGTAGQGHNQGKRGVLIEEPEGALWYCDWMVEEDMQATEVHAQREMPVVREAVREARPTAETNEPEMQWGNSNDQAGKQVELLPLGGDEDDEAGVTGGSAKRAPNCPHARLIELFHRVLPAAKRAVMTGPDNALTKSLKARWRCLAVAPSSDFTGYGCVEDGLKKWQRIFEMAARSRFLTGQVPSRNGDAPFELLLMWLVGPKNMEKVLNGYYNRDTDERNSNGGGPAVSAMAERVNSAVERVLEIQRQRNGAETVPAELMRASSGIFESVQAL